MVPLRSWTFGGITALAVALMIRTGFSDILIFNDGKMLEGEITDRGATYEVKTRFGALTVQKADIKKILKDAAQLIDEAETLRKHARDVCDEGLKLTDTAERRRKLTAGIELLEKVLEVSKEARSIVPASDQGRLDSISTGTAEEIRRFREQLQAIPMPTVTELQPPVVPPVPGPSPGPSKPPAPIPNANGKPAPPSDEAQRQAEGLIRNVFKDDYARKMPADMTALALKLLQQALDTQDDPVARFVLLREARDLAAQGGHFGAAIKAVEAMAKFYAVDPFAEKLAALAKSEATVKTPDAARILVEQYLRLMDEAVEASQYDIALRAGARAEVAASVTRDTLLIARIRERVKETQDLQKETASLSAQQKTLDANPDDPAANAAVGKFLCFGKGDWEKGVPMLAKGTDPLLKTLAAKELAKPADPADVVSLADAWWDAGEKQSGSVKFRYLARALYWYGMAAPKATGLSQTKINARVAAFDKLYPNRPAVGGRTFFQGFGATTRGGMGQEVVRVKHLGGGQDGFFDAISKGNRTVVFDVAGDITPGIYGISLGVSNITIDGTTAPPPGVTIRTYGLAIRGHDVILRGIRIRNAGLSIGGGAHNVLLDHVSVHHGGGHCLSISGARDVTVCWSIFSDAHGMYTVNTASVHNSLRVSLHHNLFTQGPHAIVTVSGEPGPRPSLPPPPEVTLDFRNNVIWGWTAGGYGLCVNGGVRGNFVGNLFGAGGGDKDRPTVVRAHAKTVDLFAAGNISADGSQRNPNNLGDAPAPFQAPTVTTTETFSAAIAVVEGSGVRPLDNVDQNLLRSVTLKK
jgi:hypothetical protein